ncbi:pyridoxamine 5'-phosphate oxidase family protein [Desulfovibrio mangrovi]|uniref:pyridoxamine 5'-phosphate oxidase family protein n=1 Tax=Desulfovibrio mangrovi TaxID=2976983 RepID=UPI002245426B|nr:pyridoxamine 5'-phosphate oxidase family protein [Desulfovibrio mangrovi]UZP66698.1 pyridoxamine 5'-phosphate oxidase family protein [Desulfovibrio mangrovi]
MQELIEFLNENSTIYLATTEQGQARVRPFQFQFEQEGRLWLCSSRHKAVYAQLQRDPRLEFTCTAKNMATLRVKGEANLDDDMAIKRRIIEENGLVRSIYGSADNPEFIVFSVDHGTAIMFDFSGNPPKTFSF